MWWKRYLKNVANDTQAARAVVESRERLEETLSLEPRVDAVTSSIQQTIDENHLVLRLKETYRQEFGEAS